MFRKLYRIHMFLIFWRRNSGQYIPSVQIDRKANRGIPPGLVQLGH